MRFRLVWYDTESLHMYDAEHRHEYLGSRDDIWALWFTLTNALEQRHVEVYNLKGDKQYPEKGIAGMIDYNI